LFVYYIQSKTRRLSQNVQRDEITPTEVIQAEQLEDVTKAVDKLDVHHDQKTEHIEEPHQLKVEITECADTEPVPVAPPRRKRQTKSPQPPPPVAPKPKLKQSIFELYPDYLNPFDDKADDDDSDTSDVESIANTHYDDSMNPFGEEEDTEKSSTPVELPPPVAKPRLRAPSPNAPPPPIGWAVDSSAALAVVQPPAPASPPSPPKRPPPSVRHRPKRPAPPPPLPWRRSINTNAPTTAGGDSVDFDGLRRLRHDDAQDNLDECTLDVLNERLAIVDGQFDSLVVKAADIQHNLSGQVDASKSRSLC
jgi:hypothetical protein